MLLKSKRSRDPTVDFFLLQWGRFLKSRNLHVKKITRGDAMEEDTEGQALAPYTGTRTPDTYVCPRKEDTEGQPLAPYTSTYTLGTYACRQRRSRLFLMLKMMLKIWTDKSAIVTII